MVAAAVPDYPGAVRVCCTNPHSHLVDRSLCGDRLYDTNEPWGFSPLTGQPLVGAIHYGANIKMRSNGWPKCLVSG